MAKVKVISANVQEILNGKKSTFAKKAGKNIYVCIYVVSTISK